MAKVEIETTHNVSLDMELSDLGERIGAALLDLLVIGLYSLIAFFLIFRLLSGESIDDHITSFLVLKFFLFLPVTFYYPVLEYFWNGQTVGKRILKLKVIRLDGAKPSLGDFVIRFLFRTIDTQGGFFIALMVMDTVGQDNIYALFIFLFFAPFPIVGMASILISKKNQRVGDLLASTLVVKLKNRTSLEDTMLLSVNEGYKPRFLNVLRLSDRDIRIIKEALDAYKKTGNTETIMILAQKTKEILEIQGDHRASALLHTVLKDYNILAVEKA